MVLVGNDLGAATAQLTYVYRVRPSRRVPTIIEITLHSVPVAPRRSGKQMPQVDQDCLRPPGHHRPDASQTLSSGTTARHPSGSAPAQWCSNAEPHASQ